MREYDVPDPQPQFPRIKEEDFNDALERLTVPSDTQDRFQFVARTIQRMHEEDQDPVLYSSLVLEAEFYEDEGMYDKAEKWSYLFGAARMYLIFEDLKRKGYNFPKVSRRTSETVHEEKMREIDIYTGTKARRESVDTFEDLTELLEDIDQSASEAGMIIMTNEIISDENPALGSWLERALSSPAQHGARTVYSLKRRQYISDELSRLFDR